VPTIPTIVDVGTTCCTTLLPGAWLTRGNHPLFTARRGVVREQLLSSRYVTWICITGAVLFQPSHAGRVAVCCMLDLPHNLQNLRVRCSRHLTMTTCVCCIVSTPCSVTELLGYQGMAHDPCVYFCKQEPPLPARRAWRCPHLEFVCCHRLPGQHPWFRRPGEEMSTEGRCLCSSLGVSSCREVCSACQQVGHRAFSQVPTGDRWELSHQGRLKAVIGAMPLLARHFVCPAMVDVEVFYRAVKPR